AGRQGDRHGHAERLPDGVGHQEDRGARGGLCESRGQAQLRGHAQAGGNRYKVSGWSGCVVSEFNARRRSLELTESVSATPIIVVSSMPIKAPAEPTAISPGSALLAAHTLDTTKTTTATAIEDAMAPTIRMRVVTLICNLCSGR